jgi:hypothetical protein
MSSARRISDLEHIVEQFAVQLSREIGGTQQAIKFLAAGLDELNQRMTKFEEAAAKVAASMEDTTRGTDE